MVRRHASAVLAQEALAQLALVVAYQLVPVAGFQLVLVVAYQPVPAVGFQPALAAASPPVPAAGCLLDRVAGFQPALAEDYTEAPAVDAHQTQPQEYGDRATANVNLRKMARIPQFVPFLIARPNPEGLLKQEANLLGWAMHKHD